MKMDQKTIVHVGTELALLGSLFYYTYKMNSQLQLQVNQLREELNDLRDYIDNNQLSSGRPEESDLSAKKIQQMIHSYIDQKHSDSTSLQNQIDDLKSKLEKSQSHAPMNQPFPPYQSYSIPSQPVSMIPPPPIQPTQTPLVMSEQQQRALASQRASEQQKLADQQRAIEQQRQMAEQQRLADQQRAIEQQRQMEQQRQVEQQRAIDQQRQMEQQRLADQQRQMEQQRLAEQQRQVEQQRAIDQQRQMEQQRIQPRIPESGMIHGIAEMMSGSFHTGFQASIPVVASVVHMQHLPPKPAPVSTMTIEEETSDNEDSPLIDEIEIDAEVAEELEKLEKAVGKNSVSRSKTKTPKKTKSKSKSSKK
jgi:hypothetical protein